TIVLCCVRLIVSFTYLQISRHHTHTILPNTTLFRSPSLFLNSETRYLMMHSSKSSPPRWVLPAVARTSMTPSPMSRMDTSKVPRSEEHTSELQSRFDLVCRLLIVIIKCEHTLDAQPI